MLLLVTFLKEVPEKLIQQGFLNVFSITLKKHQVEIFLKDFILKKSISKLNIYAAT